MSKHKIKSSQVVIAVLLTALAACTKTSTLLIDNTPEVTKTVSFGTDIIPILSASCGKSGCHNGSVSPNLMAANAYNSLVNGRYIDTGNPSNSIVYLWLTGKESSTMPLGASNNPSNINGLVLAWIKQGAKNN
ncbi:MAG TPA: hypothetical protein VL832_00415 [Puia sp.]|jgi:hypothetical protein|nr:hypothetical protein [Puia sp.]